MLTLGQIKLYLGPVNKNPKKKKNQILIFKYVKLDFKFNSNYGIYSNFYFGI